MNKADVVTLFDKMVEECIDVGHVVWPAGNDFNDVPRYALFEIHRVDGEVTVTKGDSG